ncbi:MAG TPA: hypothetical protein VE944_33460 [Nostoc sp.]|uniref:DUF7706 family protein n=1 Tax=Nostoc sp. TaxID=1180 RepID=UPI002D56F022|nr:hypothetical protein [Nostoc sp.]HYX19173.1 hypothetical protein [Nostoc sp.]
MEETQLHLLLTHNRAAALACFVEKLDHDALVRYAHPAEKDATEKALHELQAAKPNQQDTPMEETQVNLFLTTDRAAALACFVEKLDHDALVRYAHPAEKDATEKALHELQAALKEAGFDPR